MLKAVAFDLDGTLLDTIPDIAGALNRALHTCGWPTHPVETCKTFVGNGIFNAIRRALPEEATEDDVQRVNAVYQQEYISHCTEATAPYEGIGKLLSVLAERGVPMCVLTNKEESTARVIMAHYFPDFPVDHVFGRVGDGPLKPDTKAAAPVLACTGLQPEEIAFVGDSGGTDMVFAVHTGMLPVAAPWGYRSREDLVAHGARLVADDAAHLLQLLLEQL